MSVNFKKNFFFILFYLFFLIVSRLVPHEPNFTPTLSLSILAFFFFKNYFSRVFLLIFTMSISDFIIGFHDFIFYVYFSIAVISIISNKKNFIYMNVLGPIIFFIITNYGVWISSEYYSKDLKGIIECYYFAIPFFKNTILSTIFYTTILFFLKNFLFQAYKFKRN